MPDILPSSGLQQASNQHYQLLIINHRFQQEKDRPCEGLTGRSDADTHVSSTCGWTVLFLRVACCLLVESVGVARDLSNPIFLMQQLSACRCLHRGSQVWRWSGQAEKCVGADVMRLVQLCITSGRSSCDIRPDTTFVKVLCRRDNFTKKRLVADSLYCALCRLPGLCFQDGDNVHVAVCLHDYHNRPWPPVQRRPRLVGAFASYFDVGCGHFARVAFRTGPCGSTQALPRRMRVRTHCTQCKRAGVHMRAHLLLMLCIPVCCCTVVWFAANDGTNMEYTLLKPTDGDDGRTFTEAENYCRCVCARVCARASRGTSVGAIRVREVRCMDRWFRYEYSSETHANQYMATRRHTSCWLCYPTPDPTRT